MNSFNFNSPPQRFYQTQESIDCAEQLREERALATLALFQEACPSDPEFQTGLTVKNLCDLHKQDDHHLQSAPFTKFKFKNWNLDRSLESVYDLKELEQYFWNNIGAKIESIWFENCTSSCLTCPEFKEMIFFYMKNLKDVKITGGRFKLPEGSEKCKWGVEIHANFKPMKKSVLNLELCGSVPMEFGRILKGTFPKLERLSLNAVGMPRKAADILYGTWWPALPETLKDLDVLWTGFKEKHTEIESRYLVHYLSSVQLQSLKIQIPPVEDTFTSRNFQELLKSQSSSLKKLTLFRRPVYPPFSEFPFGVKMESLEELELFGNVAGDFRFLAFTPNLKRLVINRTCFEFWSNMKPIYKEIRVNEENVIAKAEVTCEISGITLNKLHFLEIDYRFSPESLLKLGRYFPKLTTLRLIAGNEELNVISNQWRELQGLQLLYGSEIDDQAVLNYLPRLQKLKEFMVYANCGEGRLTDQCVPGLVSLPELNEIAICVNAQFTENGEKLLRQKITSGKIIRNYGDHSGSCCVFKKFKEEAFAPPFVEQDPKLMTKAFIELICGVHGQDRIQVNEEMEED